MNNSIHLKRYWDKIDKKGPNECWPWTAHTARGNYGQIKIDSKMYYAHRIAWEIVNGPIPKGKLILHRCDNPLCCNEAHLYCGTQSDNMQDRSVRGRRPLLSPEIYAYGKARLHEGEIWLVRKIYKEGKGKFSQSFIARMFKVSQATISKIILSPSWLSREGEYV